MPRVQIALGGQLIQLYGDHILRVARDVVSLVQVDRIGEREDWTDAEILINSEFERDLSPAQVIARMPRLRWVHSVYAGLDDLASLELEAREIIVTNSAGAYAPMMVEYVLAMAIATFRNLPDYLKAQPLHRWGRARSPAAPEELYGKRLGIIGYGQIGRNLAYAARALGMRVSAIRRTPGMECNEPLDHLGGQAELATLLGESDLVVITAALNSSTRKLLSTREFAQMKRNAILINVARGAIVDEAALVEALRLGLLRGAVLDATVQEPLPANSPLWDAPNLLITPHISGEPSVGRQRSIDLFCDNLRLYLSGAPGQFGNRVTLSAHL